MLTAPRPTMPSMRRILPCVIVWAFCCAILDRLHAQDAGPAVLPPPGAQFTPPPLFDFPQPSTAAPEPGDTSKPGSVSEPSLIEPSLLGDATDGSTQVLDDQAELVEPLPVYEWYQPGYWFGHEPWDVGVNFGLNGSEGQNRSQSIASGAYIKRESDEWIHDSKISYNMTSANSIETQNNAMLDARLDRKLDKSPWSLYILNQTLYDEFQPFDIRVSLNTGVGYKWVNTDDYKLMGRFGAGASREFGGTDDHWEPEALFGLDYDYRLTEKQRLTLKVDYFPEWQDFGDYRMVSDLGWEIDLDKPKNMSIRFTVNDRYDSTPNGVNPNLVNYAVLLNWKL